jgi:hypothetical protein
MQDPMWLTLSWQLILKHQNKREALCCAHYMIRGAGMDKMNKYYGMGTSFEVRI